MKSNASVFVNKIDKCVIFFLFGIIKQKNVNKQPKNKNSTGKKHKQKEQEELP